MGEVFLAQDEKLHRQVALKFLPEHLTRDEERKQRFVREARAAAAIEHPHIGAIYDIDEAGGRTFMAMEYVRGESLREAIPRGRPPGRKSIELGIQIADRVGRYREAGEHLRRGVERAERMGNVPRSCGFFLVTRMARNREKGVCTGRGGRAASAGHSSPSDVGTLA